MRTRGDELDYLILLEALEESPLGTVLILIQSSWVKREDGWWIMTNVPAMYTAGRPHSSRDVAESFWRTVWSLS